MRLNERRPSFEKVHYMLRPRKQIERKIIIELLQEVQTKLGITLSGYRYVGLGSIYYYDFILFNKFLNITDMLSLDDKECKERFDFNRPFDFVTFQNISTTNYLLSDAEEAKPTITWFDYDSPLIRYERNRKTGQRFSAVDYIFEDIKIIAKKSKEKDIFITTVSLDIPKRAFDNVYTKDEFLDRFRRYLSSEFQEANKISLDAYPQIVQNMLINVFRNSEAFKDEKFRKLFSFCYQDTTPMYTLGGIFSSSDLLDTDFCGQFFERDKKQLIRIDVPLLTYREKFQLDRRIAFFESQPSGLFADDKFMQMVIDKLGFEIDPPELQSYLTFYRYYPQYYEGIV